MTGAGIAARAAVKHEQRAAPVKLTDRQTRFVSEYTIDLNATQASIRAGYSQKTARQIGAQNLTKPAVREAIKAVMEIGQRRNEVSVDSLTAELDEVRRMAMRTGQVSAAVNAIMGKAKLHGLDVSRHEVTAGLTIERIERVIRYAEDPDG